MRTYEYNEDLARQANTSNYIDSTGKYIGFFTLAESIRSQNGTEGIEFSFEDDAGRVANYLQLWTYNNKGEALYGLKVLNAMLRCMQVRGIQPEKMTVDGRDGKRQAVVFPALMNKPVGLLLQKEFYHKRNGGGLGWKMNIHAPFQAATELTALELLNGETVPEKLAGMVANLADKAAPQNAPAPGGSMHAQSENPADAW